MERIAITLNAADLKEVKDIQKRFHLRSRSEAIREIIKRFRREEEEKKLLAQVAESYRKCPETPEELKENEAILRVTLKDLPDEGW